MPKIQPVWAIDIGQAALKALKLVPGDDPEKLLAEAFDFVEYPKILSQPDADPEELIREALSTFLERNDLVGSRVAIGVSGQAGLVKFIKLPPVEKKRIPDIVKFEARQQIPFQLEEVVWDYQQIGNDDGGDDDDGGFTMAEVGLFAMKRDQINRAITPLKNAGIEVDIVQMGPIALFNFASYDRKAKDEEAGGSVVYLDIGADNTDLIITDGSRIWQRNVPIGGNHFTRALTKELKLTFAKAEHLKRNATKAPDPRAVFTAMRGIFNDFSSEVNRSIGFYSSVNRTAKIAKVVGLGNGFKLPGLQKFLQQNLSFDVEKLETFERLTGDDVVTAPQFLENLPSFAVAYGLAVQGIGKGPMKTNLLPPEIEQVRMIRRKKPWALAASALLMLAFSVLFFSDWGAYAKVTSAEFKDAVRAADAASSEAKNLKSAFDSAKTGFDGKLAEGNNLVSPDAGATDWPLLLQTVTKALPDPVGDASRALKIEISPSDPKYTDLLAKLRVHVDAVIPRWREDVKAGWFDVESAIDADAKNTMHVYDRGTPPTGPGWIVQVIGHHYNPYLIGASNKTPLTADEKKIAQGPMPYIQRVILPRFWDPELRVMGIHHAALTWFPPPDKEWTTAKTRGQGLLAPLLGYDSSKAASASSSGGPGSTGSAGFAPGPGGGGGSASSVGAGIISPRGGFGGNNLPGFMGEGGLGSNAAKREDDIKKLTRTDFKIEFVWQPPDSTKPPEDLAEIRKKLRAEEEKNKGAVTLPVDELALAKKAVLKSQEALNRAAGGDAAPTTPPPTAPAATPGGIPAPAAAPTPPVAPK